MKRTVLVTTGILLFAYIATGQQLKKADPKIILITVDGLRWQEFFTGADSQLISNKTYVKDTAGLKERFWLESPAHRREALMPFFWTEVPKMGQIHGNRKLGSKMDLTNTMWFSYPGYNEILTGAADDKRITSNDKTNNPNKTILELVHELPDYKGKVAAFGSWDVFPFIINEERSGVPVNAGFEIVQATDLTTKEKFLNELQPKIPSPWSSVRLDAFTHYYALEHMKKRHPELVYIAYGETDDFAHDGNYEAYLKSTHTTDAFIKELWDFTQADEFYKGNTIFIVTTDHGRGTEPLDTWKSHGSKIKGAGQVWMGVFGNGVQNLGEVHKEEQLYSNQIAPTILQLLNAEETKNLMKGKSLKIYSKK